MIILRLKRGPYGPTKTLEVPLDPAKSVIEYVPQDYADSHDKVAISHNGHRLSNEEAILGKPRDGDRIVVTPCAGAVGIIISLAISLVLKLGEWGINKYIIKPKLEANAKTGIFLENNRFALEVMANNCQDGAILPCIFGTHRVGGNIIQQFSRQYEHGVDKLMTLLAVSEGPISGISNAYLNGNAIANYAGASLTYKTGTNSQTAFGAAWSGTTTTVACNDQLLMNSAVTVTGTAAASRFRAKVTFVTGLYFLDGQGYAHEAEWYCRYRYREHAGPGAWSDWQYPSGDPFSAKYIMTGGTPTVEYTFRRRDRSQFSIWFEGTLPSETTYDFQFEKRTSNHNASTGCYSDSYLKEVQQISAVGLTYPNTAIAAVEAVACDQLSGEPPDITVLASGLLFQTISSATAVGAAAYTANPADIFLGVLYSRRWGPLLKINPRLEVTVSSTALDYTVGETVTGPASDYQFRGTVISWDGTTRKLILDSVQGLPHGTLTGATSTKAANCDSIDELYATDLSELYAFKVFCNEYAPKGTLSTTVDQNSNSGQANLYVTSTTSFAADDYIVIDPDGDYQETAQIDSISAGDHFVLKSNLTYSHSQANAHKVALAEVRAQFDFWANGQESAYALLERICKCSRAALIYRDGKYTARPFKEETPCRIICAGNIIEGTLQKTILDTETRPNRITIHHLDSAYDYRDVGGTTFEDPAAYAAGEKAVAVEEDRVGIVRATQALREAQLLLKRQRYVPAVIEFEMDLEAVDVDPLDVAYFGHDLTGDGYGSGRVVSATATTVTLDHMITLPSGSHYLYVEHTDGTIESQLISSAAGSHVTLTTAAWGTTPSAGDLYIVGTPARYRIMSMEPDSEFERVKLIAEEDSTAYYLDDYGTQPTFTESTRGDPDEIPPDVEQLTLAANAALNQGSGNCDHYIDVHFVKPDHEVYAKAEIWIRELAADWHVIGKANQMPGNGNGEFERPAGVCSDGTYIYVCDAYNDRIVKLDATDLSFVAAYGSAGTGNTNVKRPLDIDTDGTYLYIADTDNHRILTWSTTGGYVSQIGKAGPASGSGDGEFFCPSGICCNAAGSIVIVSDTQNHRIQKFTVAAGALTYSAKIGTQGNGNDQFERPMGIDTDGTNVYVADCGNNRIQDRLVSDLSYVQKIGSAVSGNDGFDHPTGIAVDATAGLIYVADYDNHRIHHRLKTNLSFVRAVGEEGVSGIGRSQWNRPRYVRHTQNGQIVVSDSMNHRVIMRDDEEATAGAWERLGDTTTQEYRTMRALAPGEYYQISVVSVSPVGAKKAPASGVTADIFVIGSTAVPPNVTGLTAVNVQGSKVRLSWDPVKCTNLKGYEIRTGSCWNLGQMVTNTGGEATSAIIPAPLCMYGAGYFIKARTHSGVYSATAGSVTYTAPITVPPWPITWGNNTRN